MEKLENLTKLKSLFEGGFITEKEFSVMKNEIMKEEGTKDYYDSSSENNVRKTGYLNLRFPGQWFLFDSSTKLFVNDQLHSTHSTKKGFDIEIPIDNSTISLKLILAGIKSTAYIIEDLDLGKNYSIEFTYDNVWGRYSKQVKLIENG